jgi:GTP cyclohydrolase I
VPIGFDLETNIEPVAELTLMRSVAATSECPSELSTPVYVHVVAYVPQLRVAENGVIRRF